MIKVLHIIGSLNIGGAENFVVNLYKNIDKTKVRFDFIVYEQPEGKNNYYDEVIKNGAQIYYVTGKEHGFIRNFIQIKNIVRKNNYNIVWRHNNNCIGGIDLIAAKLGGARYRILHSHSNRCGKGEEWLHYLLRPVVNCFVTERYACSREAGNWMYGDRTFQIIHNAIDIDKYKYNEEKRGTLRQAYHLTDAVVVGHVGRFHPVKNQKFLVEILKTMLRDNRHIRLVLVGGGKLEEEIKQYAIQLGVRENILFLGDRNDVADIMQMFDVFVLPSLFEGFGIAILEAQAEGIPCIAADSVPKETNITGHIKYMSLNKSVEEWALLIEKVSRESRYNETIKIMQAGYDIKKVASTMQRRLQEMD